MVISLSDLTFKEKGKYGTKASSLGELTHNGLNVPEGFALSSDFYMKFLEFNNFPYKKEDYVSCNKEIYSFMLNCSFSKDMEEVLYSFYKRYSTHNEDFSFAVRSSALCEDSNLFSMAGMFHTFLKVKSFEEVKSSIIKCYASLFSDKVIWYFVKNNLDFDNLKMCVAIQRFIEGEYSGVNFSADTIDMNEDVMHINYLKGICKAYVDGDSNSALYKVNKSTGEILYKNIPDEFTSLKDGTIKMLYEETLKIEKIFGTHEDIEWTLKDNKIYILQARPITTFKNKDFNLSWDNEENKKFTWYREAPVPYEPLVNEINLLQGNALNKGLLAVGNHRAYTDYCVQNDYLYYKDKEMKNIEEHKEKFSKRLHELYRCNKNIFQDEILPKSLSLKEELDSFAKEPLS